MDRTLKKTLIEAALGRKTERLPVWFLRQAGRYLPEYMQIRSHTDFLGLCRNPKLACEVTLQPLRRFDLDGAIIFSDILIPCTAMGQELTFDTGHGPVLSKPIRDEESFKRLKRPSAAQDLGFVGEAIGLVKSSLLEHQTMIGFAGAPFTVASYMIEGSGSKFYTEVKKILYRKPELFHLVLQFIADVTLDYLKMQVSAGAESLMLFDSWAHNLTQEDYRKHVFPITNQLIKDVKRETRVPVIYFPGQGPNLYHQLNDYCGDVLAVDWRIALDQAAKIFKDRGLDVSLQGNLDPQALIGSEAFVRSRVADIVEKGKSGRSHIFNVGHGLLPHTPPEAITWVINEIREHESVT